MHQFLSFMKYDFKIFRQIYSVTGILKCCTMMEDECSEQYEVFEIDCKTCNIAVHCTSIWHAKMLEVLVTYPVTYT